MPRTDFNGDGRDDILWQERTTGALGAWLGQQDGGFADNSGNFLVNVPNTWGVVATGDFNGDGYDDIAWWGFHVASGVLGNWFGGPNGVFTINDHLQPIADGFFIAGVGDFNGDGRDELLTFSYRGQQPSVVDIMFTTPDGDFDYSEEAVALVANNWRVVGVGDFDGDGQDDILWRNADGSVGNWLASDGLSPFNPAFTINNASIRHVPNEWHVAGVGDFNGDGADDILWLHGPTGYIGIWEGGDGGLFTINNGSLMLGPNQIFNPGPGNYLAATGDYNGDGIDDLLWRHWQTGTFQVWHGTESGLFDPHEAQVAVTNNWLVLPDYAGRGEWD